MVYRFKPLDVSVRAPQKLYGLGDEIAAEVVIHPNDNVQIRYAALNLVVEARLTVASMARTMDMGGGGTLQGGNPLSTTDYTPMSTTTNQKTYEAVAASVRFLGASTLTQGRARNCQPTLQLGPKPPKIVLEALERRSDANSSLEFGRWWIEVKVNVAMGRDQRARWEVDIDTGALLAYKPPARGR